MKIIQGTIYGKLAFLVLIVLALLACTPSPDFEVYEGNPLRIAVVGEPPKVKEEQVRFTEISFEQMANKELNDYDAVFITENNLFEAAENQYADVYIESAIPFFFIGTNNHVPFIEKDLEYDKTMNWTRGNGYAAGILTVQEDDVLKTWDYGLYNDEKNEENVKNVYSRIFMTIDELNQ